jgi:hypothetical protein
VGYNRGMKIKPEIGFQFSQASPMDANVDQNDQQSLEKWCLILGVTKEELLMAIREHGNQIKNIRKGLRKKKEEDDEAA